jgi:hypothetical protein
MRNCNELNQGKDIALLRLANIRNFEKCEKKQKKLFQPKRTLFANILFHNKNGAVGLDRITV